MKRARWGACTHGAAGVCGSRHTHAGRVYGRAPWNCASGASRAVSTFGHTSAGPPPREAFIHGKHSRNVAGVFTFAISRYVPLSQLQGNLTFGHVGHLPGPHTFLTFGHKKLQDIRCRTRTLRIRTPSHLNAADLCIHGIRASNVRAMSTLLFPRKFYLRSRREFPAIARIIEPALNFSSCRTHKCICPL